MYSGTTFRDKSGRFMGVHQRIDQLARRDFGKILHQPTDFPKSVDIVHFEGNNGPDGVKRKSPSVDEPWHYIDPSNPKDHGLVQMILDHHDNLVEALKREDLVRAAFESAWMAHAITDGLTPAHHYPLSDKIEELWGKPKEERLTIVDKNFIQGKTRRETINKNWEYWGAKGVFATHILFELGVATTMKPARFTGTAPDKAWLDEASAQGLEKVFLRSVQNVYAMDMYQAFWRNGWTTELALQTRVELIPEIIRTVTFAWYDAYLEAHQT
ncbi:MAG: hypothetical protein WAQ22_00300 [Candidatus Saccharimonas sp.]